MKIGKTAAFALLLLGAELVREWYVLRFMGFEPGRFVKWVREDEVS